MKRYLIKIKAYDTFRYWFTTENEMYNKIWWNDGKLCHSSNLIFEVDMDEKDFIAAMTDIAVLVMCFENVISITPFESKTI